MSILEFAVLLAAAFATCVGGQTGDKHDQDRIDIYYLSPQVLTRTNVSPGQLRSTEFRLDRELITREVVKKASRALDAARSNADWQASERAQFQHDFRLCLDDGVRTRWFSGNAWIMLEGNRTHKLSRSEVSLVKELFRDLDELLDREPLEGNH